MKTTILISALILNEGQVLLARTEGTRWEFPTAELGQSESIEAALGRLLNDHLRLANGGGEFLDTYYERSQDGAEQVVRNVFRVGAASEPVPASNRYSELRWTDFAHVSGLEIADGQRGILREHLGADDEALPGAPITIITGPAAAGKSTVAGLLCTQLSRSAHVEVDLLGGMIIGGYASPIPGESEPNEAAEQIRLSALNAAALARNFSLAGYEVVLDATLETQDQLDDLLSGLAGVAPVYFITLMPDAETLRFRDLARDPDLQLGQRCLDLRAIIERNGEARGLSLDNSHLSRSETVSWILANRRLGRVL
jgi:chloramphenicol 3-O-phosphotransferase